MKPYTDVLEQIRKSLDAAAVPLDQRNSYHKWVRVYLVSTGEIYTLQIAQRMRFLRAS
jgi:hypothetical protein